MKRLSPIGKIAHKKKCTICTQKNEEWTRKSNRVVVGFSLSANCKAKDERDTHSLPVLSSLLCCSGPICRVKRAVRCGLWVP